MMPPKRARLFTAVLPQQEEGPAASDTAPTSARRDREGKRLIGGYFDMAASQQLKILSAERNSTHQELVREALNDLFQKYGKSRIA